MNCEVQKTILLVEDESLIALMVKKQLGEKGYTVIHVLTGEKAIASVQGKKSAIDLILMDIDLGDGPDGTEIAGKILKEKDIPVVFLSSHTEPEIVEKTENITSYGYVVKNSGITVLDASIKMAFKLFEAKTEAKEEEITGLAKFPSENPYPVLRVSKDGSIIYANKSSIPLLNFWKCNINCPLPDELIKITHTVLKTGASQDVEVFFDNTYLSLTFAPLVNSDFVNIYGINITKRKHAEETLRKNEEKFRTLFESMGEGVVYQNSLGEIISANPAAEKILGITLDQMQGRKSVDPRWKSIQHDGTDFPGKIHPAMVSLKTGKPVRDVTMGVFHPEESSYQWLSINTIPQFKPGEDMPFQVYSTFRDITERKKAEEQTQASLREKEILLKEIHHRVKNNMTVISSMLNLQSEYIRDEKDLEIFKDSENRVKSMAKVHEKLYQSDDMANVGFIGYIRELVDEMLYSYNTNPADITLILQSKELYLDINKAIPCALIVNELISNTLKYAFPEGMKGKIIINFTKDRKGIYSLSVSDTGIGLSDGVDYKNTDSLGLRIVHALTDQLNGTIELMRQNGTKFVITFPG